MAKYQCGFKYRDRLQRVQQHGCLAQRDTPRDTPWCPECGGWYKETLVQTDKSDESNRNRRPRQRIPSGFPDLDKLLGGGDVKVRDEEGNITEVVDTGLGFKPGLVVLFSGRKGLGKTTLAVEIASNVARGGRTAIVASGEQDHDTVREMMERVDAHNPAVRVIGTDDADDEGEKGGGDLHHVVDVAREMKPKPSIIVIDSAQKMFLRDVDSEPNSEYQAKMSGNYLTSYASQTHTAVLLIGQMTKAGEAAGPEALMHAVDAILIFEEGKIDGMRIVSCPEKNRGGKSGPKCVAFLEADEETYRISSASAKLLREIAMIDSEIVEDDREPPRAPPGKRYEKWKPRIVPPDGDPAK